MRDASTVPRATYRLQLHAGFDFAAAAAVVPYLQALGVSHVYVSPILKAKKGSTHGYDVVDHGHLNEELGGNDGFVGFSDRLREHGLGLVVDIVPNHMCINDPRPTPASGGTPRRQSGNRMWWDVLENGAASRYASFFDVDWKAPEEKNRDVVLLPLLGDHRIDCVEQGNIQLVRQEGAFVFHVYEHRVPVSPRSIGTLFGRATAHIDRNQRETRDSADALGFFAEAWLALPQPSLADEQARDRRQRDVRVLKRFTARFLHEDAAAAAAVDAAVAALNHDAVALDGFLDQQNHRLAHWRTAERELDYRRFFDVNDLIGLRMEDPRVFEETHALLKTLIDEGRIQGLRVDHVDGLADPRTYLERLHSLAPRAWIVVEKIVALHGERPEELPADWPVSGTTGYEVLNDLTGVFIDPAAKEPFTALHAELSGDTRSFEEVAAAARRLVLKETLGSDVERATQGLVELSTVHRRYRDVTRHDLRVALRAVTAAYPVYRSYGRSPDDPYLRQALGAARTAEPHVERRAFDLIHDALTGLLDDDGAARFTIRFQQLTSPTAAKGVEDTAFYAWSRFLPLNEVGGDPARFEDGLARFHQQNLNARPLRMAATSTHDTKRSEDLRARLCVLTEEPERWCETVRRFRAHNAPKKTHGAPDGDLELMLYQTLVGAWPLPRERCLAYVEKAAREAKTHTAWTRVDAAFEAGLKSFVDACYDDADFVADLERVVAALVPAGRITALAQTLLKLTVPGVPDLYQGSELWTHDLVDPDNRRPVDFAVRARLLDEVARATPEQAWQSGDDGAAKLFVVQRTLGLRRRRPELFGPRSAYEPITPRGDNADAVCAYARAGGDVVVVAPRRARRLFPRADARQTGCDDAGTTVSLPGGRFVDVFCGTELAGEVALAKLLERFPVALLERM